jgi:ATP-dependent Clp protease adaptor protein ClpS
MSESGTVTLDPPVVDKRPENTKPKRLPPYAVIVENDDVHTFEYVMEVLQKVFGYELEKCFKLTEEIHTKGESLVWSGSKEVAELKVELIRSAGPDVYASKTVKFPLGARMEPMP